MRDNRAFVDSCVFIGAFNKRDSSHEKAKALLSGIGEEFRDVYTSDFVLDEVISRLIKDIRKERISKREIIEKIERAIQDTALIKLKHVNESTFASAKTCLKKYRGKYLSLTD